MRVLAVARSHAWLRRSMASWLARRETLGSYVYLDWDRTSARCAHPGVARGGRPRPDGTAS